MVPELAHIPYSPWSVRARLALAAMGVEVRTWAFTPTLSEPALRWKLRRPAGRFTLPVLFRPDGPPLEDSFDIVRWGSERSDRPLITPALVREIAPWNAVSDAMLDAGRARTTVRVMEDDVALTESLPPSVRWLGPVGRAIGRDAARRLLRKYDAARTTPDAHRRTLITGLERLKDALRGRQWLLDAFSYADLTMAVGLSFVSPHADAPLGPASRLRWTEPDLADPELLAWRDRVIAHARALREAP